jgi:hypothetical protein
MYGIRFLTSRSSGFARGLCDLLSRLSLPLSLALKWFIWARRRCILPFDENLKRLSADFEVLSFSFIIFSNK